MWDFHRYWIWGLIVALMLTTCAGCGAFGGGELSDKELIEAAGEAGCALKSIKRQDKSIERIDCHDTVRVIHER